MSLAIPESYASQFNAAERALEKVVSELEMEVSKVLGLSTGMMDMVPFNGRLLSRFKKRLDDVKPELQAGFSHWRNLGRLLMAEVYAVYVCSAGAIAYRALSHYLH